MPPHPVLAFLGRNREPKPLFQRVTHGAAYGVLLTAHGVSQLVDRGAFTARSKLCDGYQATVVNSKVIAKVLTTWEAADALR